MIELTAAQEMRIWSEIKQMKEDRTEYLLQQAVKNGFTVLYTKPLNYKGGK